MCGASSNERDQASLRQRFLSSAFRALYYELAWTYDLVSWVVSLGQWQRWVETALPHIVGEQILELGHGPGHLLIALAKRGFQFVGLDPSPQMTRIAHRRLRRAGLAGTLVRGHSQTMPFRANSFDSVVATFPTPFIVEAETLREVARILRPGGRMVVVLGARLSGRDPLSRFIEWLYFITGQREPTKGDSWNTPFSAVGLQIRAVQVQMKRSQVFLLIADRVTRDGTG